MIQKEKIRNAGYFLAALTAGLLPFAAPERCAQALREGLALCGGSLLLSLFPFLIVSTLLIQCPAAGVLGLPFILWNGLSGCVLRQQGGCSSLGFWEALPRRPAQRLRPSIPGSSQPKRRTPSFQPVSVPALPL